MMKKILIVIHNMGIGGAQKSLLSFLQCLAMHPRNKEYDIHVLPLDPSGEFLTQVPKCFTVEKPDNALRWMGTSMSFALLLRHFSLRGMAGEIVWMLRKRLGLLPKGLNVPQRLWYSWKRFIPHCQDQYDTAIAYMDGTSAYYVMDKVHAGKKMLWLHSDYQKQAYQVEFDKPYYEACNGVITVSEACKESMRQAHPAQEAKIQVLENISAPWMIHAKSVEKVADVFCNMEGIRLLTVGRLHEQKGIDIAIEAARCLKQQGVVFHWLIVGEGALRAKLEEMIAAYGLEEQVYLLGSRENPYVYMAQCDILVQPSRVEGKSIVLDEAKILCKPIVVTNYSTVHDAVVHGETGWIVAMNGEAIADGIQTLCKHPEYRQKLVDHLKRLPQGNEALVEQYIEKMF